MKLALVLTALWALILVFTWSACVRPWLREVFPPRNRRRHSLARFLSVSPTLWK